MKREHLITLMVMAGLVVICVAARLLPHPPNCTPLAAVALFSGALMGRRMLALLVPLFALLASDFLIGFYEPRIMAITYASLMLPVLLGSLVGGKFAALKIATCAAGSTAIFFFATNFGVWAFGGMYASSWSGLLECYTAALPFLKYTLAGDLIWTGIFFGSHRLMSELGYGRRVLAAAARR